MAPRASEQQRGERPARGGDGQTAQEQEAYVPPEDRGESYGDPDVLLDVPSLNVEEIDLEVEDLRAKVSFQAELADLVKINVGLDVELGRVKLQIKGVEAQVQLKARLDNVRAIFSEVLGTLQDNPQFFRDASGETYQAHEPTQEPAQGALGAGEPSETDGAVTGETDARATEVANATNVARAKARELGVDLSTLEGTGSGGRITLRDVEKAARG
jgi:pyruvate/2-oxoglutarate dehydrogenase complex dihydrolipoamide acyltransferase (E2) component